MKPKHRKQLILSTALHLARHRGYQHITREEVAKAGKITPSLVNVHFPTIDLLRAAILAEAIRLCIVEIIAQGLVMRDQTALDAPHDLKAEAASWMMRGAQ